MENNVNKVDLHASYERCVHENHLGEQVTQSNTIIFKNQVAFFQNSSSLKL